MTFNKKVVYVLITMLVLFCGMVLYFTYFQVFKSTDLVNRDGNPRTYIKEQKIKRGSIYDRNGECLAYSEMGDNSQTRVYPLNRLYSQLIGYSHPRFGRTMLESTYNNYLLGGGYKTGVLDAVFGQELTEGASLNLTIDNDLQLLAAEVLGDNKGAVVALDPSTGAVLAMASKPWFNPNNLEENWEDLGKQTGVFVPRATNGLYPPGSSFKIITAACALENGISDEPYEDTGSITIDGQVTYNYGKNVYGALDIQKAFAKSSNTYFIHLADELGYEKLKKTAENFYFNKDIPFDLPISTGTLLHQNTKSNVAAVGYGQGDTLTTPLHMAMVAGTIANGGVMMQPYLVQDAKSPEGETVYEAKPKILSRAITPATAKRVGELMVACVKSGTGTGAQLSGIEVAGKTGTAELGGDRKDHAWFVAFAPADNPKIAVAITWENAGTTGAACAGGAARIIRKWLQ